MTSIRNDRGGTAGGASRVSTAAGPMSSARLRLVAPAEPAGDATREGGPEGDGRHTQPGDGATRATRPSAAAGPDRPGTLHAPGPLADTRLLLLAHDGERHAEPEADAATRTAVARTNALAAASLPDILRMADEGAPVLYRRHPVDVST